MFVAFTHGLLATAMPLAAASHRGAFLWIIGWLVILGAVIGGAVWIVRRRRRPCDQESR